MWNSKISVEITVHVNFAILCEFKLIIQIDLSRSLRRQIKRNFQQRTQETV